MDITDDGADTVCFHAKGYQEGVAEPIMELSKCHPFVEKGSVSLCRHYCTFHTLQPDNLAALTAESRSMPAPSGASLFLFIFLYDFAGWSYILGNAHS